jgi:hypothetical protein
MRTCSYSEKRAYAITDFAMCRSVYQTIPLKPLEDVVDVVPAEWKMAELDPHEQMKKRLEYEIVERKRYN